MKSNTEKIIRIDEDVTNLKGKKVLFVNNTLSTGGAEKVMLTILDKMIANGNKVHLFIMTGMGELRPQVNSKVKILNKNYLDKTVLDNKGKNALIKKVLQSQVKNSNFVRLFGYQSSALFDMLKNKEIHLEKLAWRALADSSTRILNHYDYAVAFTEGASTYYVADYVNADIKYSFVHTPYELAGYTKQLDMDSYEKIDKIFAVSDGVKESFLNVHPECVDRVFSRENEIDFNKVREMAKDESVLAQYWNLEESPQLKLLTVARLVSLKSYNEIIKAAKLLKDSGIDFKWIALGEGQDRAAIQRTINKHGLADNFILAGTVENPYPFMKNCDVYVHATAYEGKSVAVREAKGLGAAIVLSDVPGNHGQIKNGHDGIYCQLDAEDICAKIKGLYKNEFLRLNIKNNAWNSIEAEIKE